jgi:hypothetical protein
VPNNHSDSDPFRKSIVYDTDYNPVATILGKLILQGMQQWLCGVTKKERAPFLKQEKISGENSSGPPHLSSSRD